MDHVQLEPYRMVGAVTSLLRAKASGDEYRIDIFVPPGDAPDKGWPSVFMLDASGCFATCVEAIRRMSRRPDATGVFPAVVVGISSPVGGYDVERRQRDFSTPNPQDPRSGGAATFLAFIEQEVVPLIDGHAPCDPDRRTLFGHSLAGFFTLWALSQQAKAFQRYAAISPSIWWDKQVLLDGFASEGFMHRANAETAPLAFLCIGEWEDGLPPWQQAAPGSADVIARRQKRQMTRTAADMAAHLGALLGEDRVSFRIMAEEDHASIVSAAIPRMLRMASM